MRRVCQRSWSPPFGARHQPAGRLRQLLVLRLRRDQGWQVAEVQDLRVPTLRHEQVRRLDVTMDDAGPVRRVQSFGNLPPQVQDLVNR